MTDNVMVSPSCGCVFCDLELSPDDNGYHQLPEEGDFLWAALGTTKFKCPNSPHPKAGLQ